MKNCRNISLIAIVLCLNTAISAMQQTKYYHKGPSADQFNLVVAMGIWDQALEILDRTKSKQAKKAYLLGDHAQDDEVGSNLHQAAQRAPLELLKKIITLAQSCNIDIPNLFVYADSEDGRPLKLTILDLAHSREYDKEQAVHYLKQEVFTSSPNHLVKLIARLKHGE